MLRTVLFTLLLLLAAAHTDAQGESIRYDGADFNNGTCSHKKLNCAQFSTCVQNPEHTRFKCYCPEPFLGDGYLSTYKKGATGCKLKGNPVTCISGNDCHPKASCVPVTGTKALVCICNSGYTGSGTVCEDEKECLRNPCAVNANCTEKPGSYDCRCDSNNNYEGDGFKSCSCAAGIGTHDFGYGARVSAHQYRAFSRSPKRVCLY
ncbi:hypothetical protein ACOMHN_001054 [Nucella lapillus]